MGYAQKIFFQLVLFCCLQPILLCAQDWKTVLRNSMTKWAAAVTPENVWKKYPRPHMVIKDLLNFKNGSGTFGIPVVTDLSTNTKWNQSSLFVQKDFQLNRIPIKLSVLSANNGIAEIYINGVYMMQLNNFIKKDAEVKISEANIPEKAMKLLSIGENRVLIKFNFNVNGIPINYVDFGMKAY